MATDLITSSITKNKVKIPKIGLGTYKLTGTEGQKAIENALKAGYRHIDTAKMYGNESEVGKAIINSGISREEIFVTTKIWPSDFGNLISKTEDSLQQLQTEYIDLLLLHWPADEKSNQTGAELLNEALQKGYAKNVGVSNFNVPQLEKARSIAPIICNQVEYHPYLSQDSMLAYLRKNDMFLTAYRPLAQGKITDDKVLTELAAKHNKTVGQIVLRWLIQQEDVAMIPKSASVERQKENLQVFDFELSAEEMQRIFDLERNERLTEHQTGQEWS